MSTAIALMAQGGTQWMGGLQYTAHLIEALSRLPRSERARLRILLFAGSAQREGLGDSVALVDECRDAMPPASAWAKMHDRWRGRVSGYADPWTDRAMTALGIDFVYPHHVRDHLPRRFRAAAWLPDFQHESMPQMFSEGELDERRRRFAEVAEYADRIVLSSEDARAQLARSHATARAPAVVLPFPSCPRPDWFDRDASLTRVNYHLPEHFLLVCNQFWKHKNHHQLWNALALLAERGLRPPVVLTGHTHDYRNPRHFDELLDSAHRLGIARQLSFLGVVPRADQVQLMRTAVAMLQPSRFEGWSTVVEDARALGCPILMSDIGVHREQSPAHGQYFALDDAPALAELMAASWETRGRPHDEATARAENAVSIEAFARRFVALAEGRL